MAEPRPPAGLARLDDDQLGGLAVALAVGELRWTPDVAPAVLDRISRDAVAYPDHFDRRRNQPLRTPLIAVEERSVGRTVRRLVILGVIIVLVAALVLVAATANATAPGASLAVEDLVALGGSLLVVTEAP
jgi:hypothetical protein